MSDFFNDGKEHRFDDDEFDVAYELVKGVSEKIKEVYGKTCIVYEQMNGQVSYVVVNELEKIIRVVPHTEMPLYQLIDVFLLEYRKGKAFRINANRIAYTKGSRGHKTNSVYDPDIDDVWTWGW